MPPIVSQEDVRRRRQQALPERQRRESVQRELLRRLNVARGSRTPTAFAREGISTEGLDPKIAQDIVAPGTRPLEAGLLTQPMVFEGDPADAVDGRFQTGQIVRLPGDELFRVDNESQRLTPIVRDPQTQQFTVDPEFLTDQEFVADLERRRVASGLQFTQRQQQDRDKLLNEIHEISAMRAEGTISQDEFLDAMRQKRAQLGGFTPLKPEEPQFDAQKEFEQRLVERDGRQFFIKQSGDIEEITPEAKKPPEPLDTAKLRQQAIANIKSMRGAEDIAGITEADIVAEMQRTLQLDRQFNAPPDPPIDLPRELTRGPISPERSNVNTPGGGVGFSQTLGREITQLDLEELMLETGMTRGRAMAELGLAESVHGNR